MSGDEAVVPVRAGGGSADYPVMVGNGVLSRLPALVERYAPAHRYVVVSDDAVASLHGEGVARSLDAEVVTFPAGERNKTREWWGALTDRLLEAGHGRDSVVVAVGGGVTGDLGGFVAATFMRGVPVVQVPTSLVAMIDASVGGKTGVDTPAGKNLVGAFHPPRLVVADPTVIRTLPRGERAQGLAEAVKHGAIRDATYLGRLESEAAALLAAEPDALGWAVLRSVEIKAAVVGLDERERGLRQILNFGHTLGHALESWSDYRMPHGSAVAVGMVLEARLGERLGHTEAGTADRLARVLERFELPSSPPDGVDVDQVVAFTAMDKKGRRGRARYVLPTCPGQVVEREGWSLEVPEDAVRETLVQTLRA